MTTELDTPVLLGPDDLPLYIAEQRWAETQSEAWSARSAIAAHVIYQLQAGEPVERPIRSGSFGTAFASRAWYVMVPTEELASDNLYLEDLLTLVRHSLGFDYLRIDPGLRGNKPKNWDPTTALGHLLQGIAYRVPFYGSEELTEEE